MSENVFERVTRKNKWREKFPELEYLAPFEREAFSRSLIYGVGSPEHLEACIALEQAIEDQAERIAQSGKLPKRIIRWLRSGLKKLGGLSEGS